MPEEAPVTSPVRSGAGDGRGIGTIEARTDELAEVPWRALGSERTAAVEAALLPWARAIAAAEVIRQPNPMGLPPLPRR